MQLLASGGLGRLVYNSRYGPTALPTVYRIDGESIVLGTWDPALFDEDLRTGIAHAEYQVAVEADQIDLEAREGWIVLVRGAAHHLDTEAERARSSAPGLSRGSRGCLRTSSGYPHQYVGQPRPPGMMPAAAWVVAAMLSIWVHKTPALSGQSLPEMPCQRAMRSQHRTWEAVTASEVLLPVVSVGIDDPPPPDQARSAGGKPS